VVVIDPFSLGVTALSSGLGFFGQRSAADSQRRQRNQQIKLQNRAAAEERRLQNLQIRDRNKYAAEEYQSRVNQYNAQRGFNQQAANLAYESEQQRLIESFRQQAFQRSGLQRQVLEAAGANAAMGEGRGRSFERAAAVSTYGQFGRSMEQMRQGTEDARRSSAGRMRRISTEQYGRDLAAFSNVAMAPYMQRQLPAAMQMPMQRGSGFNSMLQIGNAFLGGLNTYSTLAPPASGSLPNPYDTSGVSGKFNKGNLSGVGDSFYNQFSLGG
jgi:hypothetical protein